MKKIVILLAAGLAMSGCATSQMQQTGARYQDARLGSPATIKLKQGLPVGSILPGMKGTWLGQMERNGQNLGKMDNGMLYITGSVNRTQLKKDELSLFGTWEPKCNYALVYLATDPDGTVIFKKIQGQAYAYCQNGFVRAQPLNDGTLRVSEHAYSVQAPEIQAGVFKRAAVK